jgi:DsbC/DsbD-like thiol-disulfide interchange protein
MRLTRRTALKLTTMALVLARTAGAADWTDPVEVRHEMKRCVSYRARLSGEFVVVQVNLEPGWHTFAMDNSRRAAERLAGQQSLGVEQPTQITVSQGLEVTGPWHQTQPKDFSKPELRWFSWGFDQQAVFVAKVHRSGAGPAQVAIRGQACTESTCKNIDIAVTLPLAGKDLESPDLKSLVQVR